jgi:hypothetical protein
VTTPQTINAAVITSGDTLVTNTVSNGGPLAGNGLAGLTLGPVSLGGGTLFAINGTAHTTTVLDGDITDGSGAGSLFLQSTMGGGSAALTNSNYLINGNNTYTGGTTIQVNTGSTGSIQIGSDSPFGTGAVNAIFQGNSVEFRAIGATRTIPNDFVLDGGFNLAGDNSIVFAGDIAIASGASRLTINKITAPGETVTFGESPGSSVIYLGNPTSNGGDGVGRIFIMQANTGATTIINALFQDVAAGSAVRYGSQNGGNIIINVPQTYTSDTQIGGGEATVQFQHDYNVGDPSGPFGLGTLHANGGANARLAPTGGDRTIANPILMDFGVAFTNVPNDSSSVTLTGPVTYTSILTGTGYRVVNNVMPATGGTVIFGSAGSPSTITLSAASGQGLNFTGSGKTIINDTIQDSSPGINNPLIVSNNSTTTFNGPQITDGDFSVTGSNSTVIINGPRSSAGGSTPGNIAITGPGAKLVVNNSMTGIGTVTIDDSTATLAGTGSIDGDVTNNGTIAPGDETLTPGTLTLTGNVTNNADSRWLIGLDGATAGMLDIGGNVDLAALDSLDVVGSGTGPWVIATYAGTLTGTFDNITPGYAVDYGTGSNSEITLMTAALPGDYNNDGRVDAADYVVWRKDPASFGGDPGGYDTWAANFGNPPGGGSTALGATSAVPEPASMLLLLLALAGLPAARARR